MNYEYSMLDLFSGLGGASEAMIQNGWDVIRIENNPELTFVPNTSIHDVMEVNQQLSEAISQGHIPQAPTLIWASPPCTEFSDAYNAPRSKAKRENIPYHPDLSLVLAALKIIQNTNPTYWVIENVRGSIEYLRPFLGEPRLKLGAYVLWGNFPLFDVDVSAIPSKSEKTKSVWSDDPLRANKRAKIPYEISEALRLAIENQRRLDYWF